MKRILGPLFVLVWLPASAWSADDKASAVIDKAIKAMGGMERFAKAQTTYLAYTIEYTAADGTPRTGSVQVTVQGLENFRSVLDVEVDGRHFKTMRIINGDEGWSQSGRGTRVEARDQVGDIRGSFVQRLLPARPDLLKLSALHVEWAGEEAVGDRPAVVLNVTGQDIVRMKIYFDKELGLPIKSETKMSMADRDYTSERTLSDYRDFDGFKVATKIKSVEKIEAKPDGESLVEHIKEFKVLDKVPPHTFTEPK